MKDAGFDAYLVGGGVRDLLLGREPKDFDIATNAHPDEVKAQFRNCRIIGRRFRLAHVHFGREVVEVATFRAAKPAAGSDAIITDNGRIVRDNSYGTIEEDAWRRDFTVNALYYNIRDFSVVDFTGGLEDLEHGVLRLIGDPVVRYHEDPVRMLRAVRFAAKLGFRIHEDTERPLLELGRLLTEIPAARLYEEVLKLFLGGAAVNTFELLRHYGLFQYLFRQCEDALNKDPQRPENRLVTLALENTDERIAMGKSVTPGFLFAALLWAPMRDVARELQGRGLSELQAFQQAGGIVLRRQLPSVAITKRYSLFMRDIWQMQPRLAKIKGRRALRLLALPRFRAAYDFLLLRQRAGEDLAEICDFWKQHQDQAEARQEGAAEGTAAPRRRRRKRPRRRAAQKS